MPWTVAWSASIGTSLSCLACQLPPGGRYVAEPRAPLLVMSASSPDVAPGCVPSLTGVPKMVHS